MRGVDAIGNRARSGTMSAYLPFHFLSARFSAIVLAGFFFGSFFLVLPFSMGSPLWFKCRPSKTAGMLAEVTRTWARDAHLSSSRIYHRRHSSPRRVVRTGANGLRGETRRR